MLAETYSTNYKNGSKQHGTHLQDLQEERADMLARNRRMQLETSKRRRALASKRKMEVRKEEKRRQTILSKRREQIREATEKYQRLNKNYTKFQADTGQQTRIPGLDEALRAVRGSPRYLRRSLSHDGIIQKPSSCSPRQDAAPSHPIRYTDNTYTKSGSLKRNTHRTNNAYMTRPYQTLHSNDQGTSHQRSDNDVSVHGQRPSYGATNQRLNDTQYYYNSQGHLQTRHKHQSQYQHQGRNNDTVHQDGVSNGNHYNHDSAPQAGVNNGTHYNYTQDPAQQIGVIHGASSNFNQDSTHAANNRTRHNYNNYTAGNYQNNAQMELQTRSLRNRTNSRTLFEQQLEQYQHRLAEEQKRSLHQFNDAIQQEMERDKQLLGEEDIVEIPKTVSPCSVDSLDDTRVSVLASQSDSTIYDKSDENVAPDRAPRVHSAPVAQTNVTGRNGNPENVKGVSLTGVCTYATSAAGDRMVSQASHGNSVPAQSHANGNTGSMYTASTRTNTASPVKAVAVRAGSSQPSDVGLSSFPVQGVAMHPASSQPSVVSVSSSPVKSAAARPTANQVNPLGVSSASTGLRSSSRVAVVQPSVMQTSTNLTSFSQKQGLFNSGPGPKEWRDNAETNSEYNALQPTTDYKRVNIVHTIPASTKTYATVSGNNDHFRQDASVNFVHTFDGSNNHLENSNVLTGQFSRSDARSDDAFRGRTKAWTTPTSDEPETVTADLCRRTDSKANTTVTYSKPYLHGTTATNITVTSQYDDSSAVTSHSTHSVPVPPSLASFYQNPQLLTEAVTTPVPGSEVAMATHSSHRNTTQSQIQRQKPPVAQPGSGYTAQPQSRRQTESEDILEESESDVEEESKPIPQKKVIKGILKKSPGGSVGSRLGVRGRRHVLVRSLSATASVRDSVEVTKQHLHYKEIEAQTKPRRKSVRFADLVYEDDSESQSGEDPIEEQMFDPTAHNTTTEQEQRPSRPASAKQPTSTPSSRVTTHIPRANSAGTEKRGPFIRPHPPAHPPTGRAMASRMAAAHKANPTTPLKPAEGASPETKHPPSTHGHPTSTPTSVASHQPSSTHKQNSSAVNNTAENVYSSDGLRLDRTPTDDEISWLWQKVRTCLSRDSTHQTSTASHSITTNAATSRTTAQISQKYMDGNSLASKMHVSNRPPNTATAVQIPVKKVTMDALTSYNKKQNSLLQQRRQYGATNAGMTPTATTQSTIQTLPCQQPMQSSTVPASTLPGNAHPHISESMAAFLAAEMLSKQSAGEGDIEHAMEQAQYKQRAINASRPTQHVPTAISVEEQRLLASLDRLNERLKVAETKQINNTPAFAPKPPYQYGTFRGHKPLLSRGTRRFVNNNGTVSRYNFRNAPTAYDQTGLHRHR